MAKYNKNAKGLYETSKVINGKRVRFRGKTIADVDRKLMEYDERRKMGRKLAEIADDWQREHEKQVTESTIYAYRIAFRKFKAYFGDRRAGDVRPIDIKRYIADAEAEGLAAMTVAVRLTVCKQIFKWAVEHGEIDASPARDVNKSRGLAKTKRPALTEEQELAVEKYRGEDYLLGLFLLYTGMRRGELLALTWQDIDLKTGVIHVTKKLNYAGHNKPVLENHLKSKNGLRDVPLLADLREALPREKMIGKIFTQENGDYLRNSDIFARWKAYCQNAGIEGVTMHQFRHSFATLLYEAGIDEKAAAAMLGDTEEVTRGTYQELRDTHRTTSADKVNAYLSIRRKEAKQA